MLTLSTLYRIEKTEILKTSMNFLSEMNDRKESEEEKKFSKQMCVSSQQIRMRKEEGATVAASHLPSLSWLVRYLRRAVLGSKQRLIQTIGKAS